MSKRKQKQATRPEVLFDSLKPLAAKVDKDDLRRAVYATTDAFKQGDGMLYSEFEELLSRLYPLPAPTECDICGRIICDGHYGEGFQ
jgi:hypothetical protein